MKKVIVTFKEFVTISEILSEMVSLPLGDHIFIFVVEEEDVAIVIDEVVEMNKSVEIKIDNYAK